MSRVTNRHGRKKEREKPRDSRNLNHPELFLVSLELPLMITRPLLPFFPRPLDRILDDLPHPHLFQHLLDLWQSFLSRPVPVESVGVPLVGFLEVEEEEGALDRDEPVQVREVGRVRGRGCHVLGRRAGGERLRLGGGDGFLRRLAL